MTILHQNIQNIRKLIKKQKHKKGKAHFVLYETIIEPNIITYTIKSQVEE